MRKPILAASICAMTMLFSQAYAEEHPHSGHPHPMPKLGGDERLLVEFPPDVRLHFLANMRTHLEALSNITLAMADGRYREAAMIAETRLGMDSPSAAGCSDDHRHGQRGDAPALHDHQRMRQSNFDPPFGKVKLTQPWGLSVLLWVRHRGDAGGFLSFQSITVARDLHNVGVMQQSIE